MPRSKGQLAYYEIICTYKLGDWLKNDLNEVISIETGEKTDYTSKELLKEYKDAWIPSLPLDLLPFCLKTFKNTQKLLQTLNE